MGGPRVASDRGPRATASQVVHPRRRRSS
jgi:hypothetical protein